MTLIWSSVWVDTVWLVEQVNHCDSSHQQRQFGLKNAACWEVSPLNNSTSSSSTSWCERRLINIKCEHDSPSLVWMSTWDVSVFAEMFTEDVKSCRPAAEGAWGVRQVGVSCVSLPAINVVNWPEVHDDFRLQHRQWGESDDGVAFKMCEKYHQSFSEHVFLFWWNNPSWKLQKEEEV